MIEKKEITPVAQRSSRRPRIVLLFLVTIALLLVTGFSHVAMEAPVLAMNSAQPETQNTAPSCRYGVSSWNPNDTPFLEDLGVGWTLDFFVNVGKVFPNNIEYTPIVRMKQEFDPVTGERLPSYEILRQPLTDDPDGLGPLVLANPGHLWLVGNEVDRVFWQDDIMPDIYAEAYHDVYHFIKERDPSARVAISGLVQVTPGRLQYLDLVWDAYLSKYGERIPVDVWNMHVYILPERREYRPGDPIGLPYYDSRAAVALGTDPNIAIWESDGTPNQCAREDVYCNAEHDDMNIFISQVRAMRQWMKDRGEHEKPLILSEFSLLYPFTGYDDPINPTVCFLMDEYGNCFTEQRVINFMNSSLDYLETATDPELGYPADNYRLVQQWLWYTMNDETEGTVNKLVDYEPAPGAFTAAGSQYRVRATWNARIPNMIVTDVNNPVGFTTPPTNTTSVSLTATILNNGNTLMDAPLTVTFYEDAQQTAVIGTATISQSLQGCGMQEYTAAITWHGLSSGIHPFWAKVSGGSAPENLGTGIVIIDPAAQLFLPVVVQR